MNEGDPRLSYPPAQRPPRNSPSNSNPVPASPPAVPALVVSSAAEPFDNNLTATLSSPETARDVKFNHHLKQRPNQQNDTTIDSVFHGDQNTPSSSHTSLLMRKLRHGGSSSGQGDNASEKDMPQSNFFSSVLSAAQNVTSVLRGSAAPGTEHRRSASDCTFFGFINDAAQPFSDPLAHLSGNGDEPDSIQKVSDVKIEPVRSAISTLGKGELSLESLGLTPKENNGKTPGINPGPPVSLQSSNFPPTASAPAHPSNSNLAADANLNHAHSSAIANGSGIIRDDHSKAHDISGGPLSPSDPLDPRRQSLDVSTPKKMRRPRHSLIGRMGADKSKDTRPSRSQSVTSVHRTTKSRQSLPDEQAEPETSSPKHYPAQDSDDSEKPKRSQDNEKHLAGFAYANKKRNHDFHKLFRTLSLHDFLLDDFSCALNRDILIQGRMYVSERNICFNSNILGWVTNLIVNFDEIVGLEKKTTAGLFPNGIVVQTLHARHNFASFISRDTVFDFLMSIWRQTNARTEISDESDNGGLASFAASEEDSDNNSEENSDSGFEEYDDSAEELDELNSSDDGLSTDEEFGESARQAKPPVPGATTKPVASPTPTSEAGATPAASTGGGKDGAAAPAWPVPNLGPDTHEPTDPHYNYEAAGEKLLVSETVAAPLGVVVNLLFGDDVKWISNFITEKEKNVELKNMAAFEGGIVAGSKRNYEYVKPLSAPVGPKQTRCICTDTLETVDLDSQVVMVTSTATPDVPSGSVFTTKTRLTIFWGENNTTKVLLTYFIEWTGKSWFKSPIEKGTHDGQMSFAKNLVNELNASVKKKSAGSGGGSKSTKGAKKGTTSSAPKKKKKSAFKPKKEEPVPAVRRVMDALTSEPFGMVPIPTWGFILLLLVLIWTFQAMSNRRSISTSTLGGGTEFYSPIGSLSKEKLDLLRMEEEYNVWRWIDDRSAQGSIDSAFAKRGKFKRSAYYEQNLEEAIKLTELRVARLRKALGL